jgi:hypothetical protein
MIRKTNLKVVDMKQKKSQSSLSKIYQCLINSSFEGFQARFFFLDLSHKSFCSSKKTKSNIVLKEYILVE